MTRLILNRPHTHAGRRYTPGDVLEVDPTTTDWLIAQDVASPESEPISVEADSEPKPKSRSSTSLRQEPQP